VGQSSCGCDVNAKPLFLVVDQRPERRLDSAGGQGSSFVTDACLVVFLNTNLWKQSFDFRTRQNDEREKL
jgi:hypothetical protein